MPIIVLLLAHALWNPRIAQRVWLELQPQHYPNAHTRDLMALLATERPAPGVAITSWIEYRLPVAAKVAHNAAQISYDTRRAHPPKRLVELLLEAIPPAAL